MPRYTSNKEHDVLK